MKNSKLGARNNRSKMDNSVELNRLKGRPRKKTIEESSSNEATKALVKMPKGRPRKRPREESPSNEAMADISSKRPKGRPRKKPIEESPSNEATKAILALVNEATKENLAQVKRPRGQPRKNPTNDTLDNLDSSNQYVQALAIEYPQDSPGLLAIEGIFFTWDVPLPYAMKSVCSSSNGEGTDPRFVKLKPVFRCSTLKCGGIQSADTVTIRAITWVPSESDQGSPNLFLTAGHWGLKFCDIRDSFRPLWDLHPAPKLIYSLDWLPDPRCIILSFDDTMRRLSLAKAANDAAVNGQPSVGPKQLGMHVFNCSSFAIWSIQLSRLTGTLVLSFALVLK
ncbi:hypothetical protein NC651_015077 [Populus alba x Populus x berolinensis]|nr:hypothetical protein NC651_015077 [Populus alba x Populus x berolinensis]